MPGLWKDNTYSTSGRMASGTSNCSYLWGMWHFSVLKGYYRTGTARVKICI